MSAPVEAQPGTIQSGTIQSERVQSGTAQAGIVRLGDYNNSWYRPGRSRLWQAAWFFLGLPVLRCSVLPGSGLRVRLLRLFGARIGQGVVIKPSVNIKYPWNLTVGSHCWIGEACWIDSLTQVTLGENVCLSQGSYLCTGNHDWADPRFGLILAPIEIREGAWVGARATVMPGVVMGAGSIAAAGSVVSRSIPEFEIHAGNPASFRKRRAVRTAAPDGAPHSSPVTGDGLPDHRFPLGVETLS